MLRRLALLADSEVGYQFLVRRHCLRSGDLLKSERSREDSGDCLLLTRKALAFTKHSDKGQALVLICKQTQIHFQLTSGKRCFYDEDSPGPL